MNTQCTGMQLEFQGLGRRNVFVDFARGHVSSDGGALLLRAIDERLRLTERLVSCFTDYRNPEFTEHRLLELLRQRIYGIALAYEDLNDHDDLMRAATTRVRKSLDVAFIRTVQHRTHAK